MKLWSLSLDHRILSLAATISPMFAPQASAQPVEIDPPKVAAPDAATGAPSNEAEKPAPGVGGAAGDPGGGSTKANDKNTHGGTVEDVELAQATKIQTLFRGHYERRVSLPVIFVGVKTELAITGAFA